MIKVIPAKNHYKPDLGDLVCVWFNKNSDKYLVSEEGPNTDKIIPLVCAYPNPFRVCEEIFEIDTQPIIAKYKCPYTGYENYAIVPVALLINGEVDAYKGIKFHSPDYLLDWEFHKHMIDRSKGDWTKDDRLKLYDIQKLLLGSGYTSMTGHYDGSGRPEQRRVMLDNGDALWVYFWEWYNK